MGLQILSCTLFFFEWFDNTFYCFYIYDCNLDWHIWNLKKFSFQMIYILTWKGCCKKKKRDRFDLEVCTAPRAGHKYAKESGNMTVFWAPLNKPQWISDQCLAGYWNWLTPWLEDSWRLLKEVIFKCSVYLYILSCL